jgi:hypothetical protein
MAKTVFKVERIESSEGMRVKRDATGKPVNAKRQVYDRKKKQSIEVDDDDVICEPAPVKTVVMSPVDDLGPSDRLFLSTTNEELAKQFKVGKEYALEFNAVR